MVWSLWISWFKIFEHVVCYIFQIEIFNSRSKNLLYKHFQIQAFIILFRFKSILCLIHNAQAGVLPVFCYQTKVTDAYCLKKSWKTFRPIIKSSNSYPCSYWVRPFEFLTRNYEFCYHWNILIVNQARPIRYRKGDFYDFPWSTLFDQCLSSSSLDCPHESEIYSRP